MKDAPASDFAEQSEDRTLPLRVLVITEDDPLYVIEFFKVFFDELPAGDAEVIGVTVDQAFHEPILKTLKRMLSLYGWTGVFRLGLRYVWAKMRGDTIAAMARRRGLPLLETPSVNDPAYLARIRDLRVTRTLPADLFRDPTAPPVAKAAKR